jgi:hypothetical protein
MNLELQPYTLSGSISQYCYRVHSNGWHKAKVEVRSSSGECWITNEAVSKGEELEKFINILIALKVHERPDKYFKLSGDWSLWKSTDIWFERCCDNLSFSVTANTKEKVERRSDSYLSAICDKRRLLEVSKPTKMRENLWYLYGKILK